MSRPDAERAMEIYKNFTKQTDFVVAYLSTARQYEHQTRVEVPKLKHAPVNLGKQLEDYLMDPDFEINRRQYLAEQESKKGRGANGSSKPFATSSKSETDARAATGRAFPETDSSSKPVPPAKGPAPDLIDFFDSIEQNQQPMATQPGLQQQAPQFNGSTYQSPPFQQIQFASQQTSFQSPNPFQQQHFNNGYTAPQQPQQVQPNFTGAGFGGYTPQPSFQPGGLSSIPQDAAASFQPAPQQQGSMQTVAVQTTNPFRQSMIANQTGLGGSFSPPNNSFSPPTTAFSPPATGLQRQSTNPFAKSSSPQGIQPFSPPTEQNQFQQSQYPQSAPLPQVGFQQPQQPQQQEQQQAPLRSMTTGTNPFAKNIAMNAPPSQRPQTSGGLVPQPTGSTNPFRQSQFVNTATGQGWQNNQQPIGGGLDHLETLPVFPRPAQQQAWQQ
jgi:hypothetical protein